MATGADMAANRADLEHLPVERLRASIARLLDIMRCAICLDTVKTEMIHCVNGHVLCATCKTRDLVTCPSCREPFSDVQLPRFTVQMVEALPRQCKHAGCIVMVAGDDHEFFCGYKETSCRLCGWLGAGKDIMKHLADDHPTVNVFGSSSLGITWHKRFDRYKKSFCKAPIYAYGQFFWADDQNEPEKKTFTKTFYWVPNGKCEENIYVEVIYNSTNESKFLVTFKLNLNANIVPEEENRLSVPWHMLPEFINKDGKLQHSLYFTKA